MSSSLPIFLHVSFILKKKIPESFHVIRTNLLKVRVWTDPDLPNFGNILSVSIEIICWVLAIPIEISKL